MGTKNRRTIVNPPKPAQLGGKLPIISPHDTRNAKPGDVSHALPGRHLANVSIRATLHDEPPSQELPAVVYEGDLTGYGTSWVCGPYYGIVRRYPAGFPIGGGPFAILSISSTDETARHDWRDFQQLKNRIVGEEWEACELYPAESRLLDPSNRFYLWCVPKNVFVFGLVGRSVLDRGYGSAPQRPFPKPQEPAAAEGGK